MSECHTGLVKVERATRPVATRKRRLHAAPVAVLLAVLSGSGAEGDITAMICWPCLHEQRTSHAWTQGLR